MQYLPLSIGKNKKGGMLWKSFIAHISNFKPDHSAGWDLRYNFLPPPDLPIFNTNLQNQLSDHYYMDWALAGIVFGFLGSFHCIGMCGPLALALPGADQDTFSLVLSRLVYNFGRVITYSALGVAVGLLSQMVAISGFQQWLSISVGVFLLLGLTISAFRQKINEWKSYPSKLMRKATAPIKSLFKKGTLGSLFLIGLLNGLLPCGFVYMALATALTTGTVLNSLYFMAGFGLGTIPAMLGVSLASGLISVSLRQRLKKFSPYFIAVVGILLILRGLNLAIPFISPKL